MREDKKILMYLMTSYKWSFIYLFLYLVSACGLELSLQNWIKCFLLKKKKCLVANKRYAVKITLTEMESSQKQRVAGKTWGHIRLACGLDSRLQQEFTQGSTKSPRGRFRILKPSRSSAELIIKWEFRCHEKEQGFQARCFLTNFFSISQLYQLSNL